MPGDPTRLPTATYRVQLHKDFGFEQAAAITDYLAELSISHLYSSPYLQASPGSLHGYDTVDHSRVSSELGGFEGHKALCQALQRHKIGQVLDIVPNHMGIAGADNPWWQDVLENGKASRYATYFDVDWDAPEAKLHDKVLLPILGDHYGRALQAGQIQLRREGAEFHITYFQHALPVDFCTLGTILGAAAHECDNQVLAYIADAMGVIPLPRGGGAAESSRCARDRGVLRRQLGHVLEEQPVAAAVDTVIARVNRDPDALDDLVSRQHYRLAYWRTADDELNYRRFFDINTLIGIRVEEEPVFAAVHALPLRWVKEGHIDGLRVDHPDGLRDPQQYFERLAAAAPDVWVIAEKILEPGEHLRETWPIDGTTGYDFLNLVGGLLVNPEGEGPLTAFYGEFTGQATDFAEVARDCKHLLLERSFGGELNRLTSIFVEVCERHREYRDFTRRQLREALAETIACLPVYRTYVQPHKIKEPHGDDVRCVRAAIDAARRHRPDMDGRLLRLLGDLLLLQVRGQTEGELVLRFQQLSGPVMAKAIEDTAFYRYHRLVCLNEVGGNPGQFGVSVETFHRQCLRLQENWPYTMTTTSTHDTKRSEDVRARLALLASIPQRWIEAVRRWAAINEKHRSQGQPDRNAEYLLYQTLVGAWPIEADRVTAYMRKAAREAKVHTSWTDPNPPYEEALAGFVAEVMKDGAFLEDLEAFVRPLVPLGRINSLSQALIKFTAPGVPDIYQGNEVWDLSLVDPDNRRPVDYERRRCLLGELDRLTPDQILARSDEGLPKLWLTRQVLRLRQQRPVVFRDGEYQPLTASGEGSEHVVAFGREEQVVTVAQRLPIAREGEWGDTRLELPAGTWRNVLTGQRIEGGATAMADLLEAFPVALLERQ